MQAETRDPLGNTGWLYLRPLPFLARRSIVRGRPIYLLYTGWASVVPLVLQKTKGFLYPSGINGAFSS
ncbi:hypothetical protein EAG_01054 [Camponotus floridanus]|uniref:Uncharacterized protein n=1 Tax=Camponotus floridanus TaxID=104421 RepID=E2AB38_CAMFO|nr:hypothetical protein EAG_01054 [Camponotus floridanus]